MTPTTQDTRVLDWLLLGLPLTQYEANYNKQLAVSRLASIINRLEKNGWSGFIKHENVKVKNQFGQMVISVSDNDSIYNSWEANFGNILKF